VQEISMLAGCKCKNITEYYASIMRPGGTELVIVMELMACSVADLVGVATARALCVSKHLLRHMTCFGAGYSCLVHLSMILFSCLTGGTSSLG
jgi:hypothetical protein